LLRGGIADRAPSPSDTARSSPPRSSPSARGWQDLFDLGLRRLGVGPVAGYAASVSAARRARMRGVTP